MKRLLILFTLFLTLIVGRAVAQEDCDNGVDDDGNNFVDCFDSACATDPICEGFYVGNDADCQTPPPSFPNFKMAEDWESANETTNHLNRISIGDLDHDGVPEVVSTNIVTDRIFIISGATGGTKSSLAVDYDIERENIIADIKRNPSDTTGEVFAYGKTKSDSKWRIYAYSYSAVTFQLTEIWRSPAGSELPDNPFFLSIANFDGDAFEELYYKDEVVDAHTGVRLIQTESTNIYRSLAAPVAVDVLGDSKLDLVSGGRIYEISLPARTLHSGTRTLSRSTNLYRIRQEESSTTSVADYNLDGQLDVIMTGSHYTGASTDITANKNKNTTVFFWNLVTDVVTTYIDAFPDVVNVYDCKDGNPGAVSSGTFYSSGWRNGTGRINIADIDGDGKMNAVYVSGKFLYALNENWQLLWPKPIVVNEETSGYTGCTMFDFNGDGESEIVYRDEKFIYIIYGDGTVSTATQPCVSRTNREYPIVADVDNDGESEICVTCAYDDNLSDTDFCNQSTVGNQRYSVIRAYRSDNGKWVPARKVWNQNAYFNVNINDDLSIPKIQQKHHLTFYTGACKPGDPVKPRRPLNSFLNQAPFVDSKGCPIYATPDLAFVDNSLSVNAPTCPERNFTVSFKIVNKGDIALSGKLPITFYNGDPEDPSGTAVKIDTVLLNLKSLGIDQELEVKDLVITGPGSTFNLYIMLNDAGTSTPPVKLPNTNFVECDPFNNVVSAPVVPLPAPLVPELIKKNIKCAIAAPDNGAVKAFVPVGATGRDTINYNFYWSDGGAAKPIPADHQGHVYTGLAGGTYTVFAIHKTVSCGSDTVDIIVPDTLRTVNAKVIKVQDNTHCEVPNGELRVVVNDTDGDGVGEDVDDFSYFWFDDAFSDTLGIDFELKGLKQESYSVLLFDKATGCSDLKSGDISDILPKPEIDTSHVDITCSNANQGVASAWVKPPKTTTGYTFYWSNGTSAKPVQDFTGPDYINRPAGSFTVVAQNNTSKCKSDTVTVKIKKTPPVVVSISSKTDMTSCDAALPNGTAIAGVSADTIGYSFEWFKGQNTLAINKIGAFAAIKRLAVGIYTVRVTDSNGCTDTEEVTINFAVVPVTLALASQTNSSLCSPPNGSITVSVTPDAPTDYTFSWYNGTSTSGAPHYTVTGPTLTGLAPGKYSVKAINNLRHCETNPITVEIKDISVPITFNPSRIVRPSDCNDNHGELDITLSAPGNVNGFEVVWYKGRLPGGIEILRQTVASVASGTGLSYGVYTLVVKNLDNGCTAEQHFDLPFDDAQILILDSVVPINTCDPGDNGSITVLLSKTIPGYVESDYEIYVYTGSNDPVAVGAPDVPFTTITCVDGQTLYTSGPPWDPGVYTFVAKTINPSRGTYPCRSVPVTVELEQITVKPKFTATTPTVNTNCAGTVGTGQISLTMTGPTVNPNDYDFNWFEGKDITGSALGTTVIGATEGGTNGEIAQNLKAGFYTVQVIKKTGTGANSGCDTTATFQIFDNPPIVTFARADVDIVSVSDCNTPLMGSATINSVRENGTSMPFANYNYAWFDETGTGIGSNSNILSGLAPGKYYVVATHKTSNCSTGEPFEFTISDSTINTVEVNLVDFTIPSMCLKPVNIIGELEVIASGTSNAGYTYRWFEGTTTTTPLGTTVGNTGGPNGEIAQNLTNGFYTIEVENNQTHCTIKDTYELPLDTAIITISASASPLTFCSTPNGSVFAIVTSADKDLYSYNWYRSGTIPPPYEYDTRSVVGLSNDTYIVVAIDLVDARCTVADTVTVEDGRVYPIVAAMGLNPLTNCDEAKPDGVVAASVGGDVINYSFDWYGETITPPPFITGSQISNLTDSTYTVIASHIVTGCSDTTQVTINFSPIGIPVPQIQILSQVTSCDFDNGALAASVSGNTVDYIFDWSIGQTEKIPPDFTGDIYDSLAVGIYTVTATSRITGCKSQPVSEDLIAAPIYPDFSFIAEPSTCKQNDTEPGNGFASIFLNKEIPLRSIEWSQGGVVFATGPIVTGLDRGDYLVTVTSAMGCSTSVPVKIETQIHPFNGVSRNGDGKNDIFFINCIGDFPDNVVKIFNRAGTLVYEHEGYNNLDVYFDGKSNKGISLMGNNLPDGTYFYIIDKRDGTKPVAGYLEIVN